MAINQRDVYLLPFPLGGVVQDHPFIVLSIREANEIENSFIAVMITSSDVHKDDYSFDLNDSMFEKPLPKKGSHVRMHLITIDLNKKIRGVKLNTMKEFYFKQLMLMMGELVFNYNFEKIV